MTGIAKPWSDIQRTMYSQSMAGDSTDHIVMTRFGYGTTLLIACLLATSLLAQANDHHELRPGAPAFANRIDPLNDPPQTEPMQVDRDYDRFQDKTTVRVEGIRPGITKGESRIFINATCSFDGAEVAGKPDKVAVNLLSVAEEFQFADTREGLQFIMLIDKKRIRVPARFIKAGTSREKEPKSLESFVAILDSDMLIAMSTAQSVEAQLGNSEFKLGAMEQLSLHQFCETVGLLPPSPKPAAIPDLAQLPANARVDAVAMHLAQARVDEAQEKVDKLTAACLKKLEQNDTYSSALKSAQDLEARKDKLSAGPERGDVSQQWLEAKAKLSLIKSSALLEDAELSAARRQLAEAQAAMRPLQRKVVH